MNFPFTTEQYILKHELGVLKGDTKGYHMVAEHLRVLGYDLVRRRVDGKELRVWVRVDRQAELTELERKLKEIADESRRADN